MSQNQNLTNEKLTTLFDNPFDLVNHAIGVAHHVIESGRELGEGSDQNSASQILKKVLKERQSELQSQEILEKEKQHPASDKDLPDPMLQAI